MDYEGSKKALMDIFAEDMVGQKNLDLSEYVFKLMQVVASGLNKESKFKRILNIIREWKESGERLLSFSTGGMTRPQFTQCGNEKT